ncbi:hypothetical protein [Haloferula rosea]|uniref:Uncharacterized protein n=1 Tax=Haloferula rosea TaxID=490093 RepID=A0A934RA71_9BACT|nr:hypothetical protein [Haloferula rosea]MBK1825897.1 hypothetical protein [Haloferula rosea]
MSLPPHTTTLIRLGILASLTTSPGWCAELSGEGSPEAVPEPAVPLLGLLGLCLILLRRNKP